MIEPASRRTRCIRGPELLAETASAWSGAMSEPILVAEHLSKDFASPAVGTDRRGGCARSRT